MHAELEALDLSRSVPALEVPVIFLLGRYDRHVSAGVASDYFAVLRAPGKRPVWFEDSAHNPPFEEPEHFQRVVVDALRSMGIAAAASETP
jgi:proline iminopeptidase